jgi:hypothetical protein
MTLHETLINLIGGKRLANEHTETRAAFDRVYGAYEQGRFRLPPDVLLSQLSEYNSSTVLQLVRQLQSGQTGAAYLTNVEDARLYQVQESRYLWLYSPLAQWSVNCWTNYGLGEKVTITCNDENAELLWDEVWHNSAIFDDDAIQELSNNILVDGEIYLAAFISITDGTVKFELLDGDEITAIITNPDNKNEPLYYRREFTGSTMSTTSLYYPDWHAYFYHQADLVKAKLAADAVVTVSESMDQNKGTAVLVLHIAHNRKSSKSLHGWPILGIAAFYLSAHKQFVETRLTVARNKASFVRELTVQGGSRGVASVKSRFDSGLGRTGAGYVDPNPAPIGGAGTMIHNAGITSTDLPMTTGAGDASEDNKVFSWMALIGTGLFPTTAGLDTSRWATAVAMDKTQAVQWARYQSFWACQFRKMVEIVLLAAEKWGSGSFEDKGCTVSIDTLSLVDFPGVVGPIAQMIGTIGSDATIPEQAKRALLKALWTPVLTALGTDDIDEVLSDDLLEILDEDERAALKLEQEQVKKNMMAIQPAEPVVPPESVPTEEAQKYRLGISNLALEMYHQRIAEGGPGSTRWGGGGGGGDSGGGGYGDSDSGYTNIPDTEYTTGATKTTSTQEWTTAKGSKMKLEANVSDGGVDTAKIKINADEYDASISPKNDEATIKIKGQRVIVRLPSPITNELNRVCKKTEGKPTKYMKDEIAHDIFKKRMEDPNTDL